MSDLIERQDTWGELTAILTRDGMSDREAELTVAVVRDVLEGAVTVRYGCLVTPPNAARLRQVVDAVDEMLRQRDAVEQS